MFLIFLIIDRQLDDLSYVDRELYMMKVDNRSTSNELCNQSVKSMPDLYASEEIMNIARPNSTDLILEEHNMPAPLYLTMSIVKGSMGFGFTIADSAHGQKVGLKYIYIFYDSFNIFYLYDIIG